MRHLPLLLLLLAFPVQARAQASADTTRFVVDPARSSLRFEAQLNTVLGNSDDEDASVVSGTVSAVLWEDPLENSQVHVPAFRLVLDETMEFEFPFGLFGLLGIVHAEAEPGALALAMRQPGTAVPLIDSTFIQTNNDVALQGQLHTWMTNAAFPLFPDTTLGVNIGAMINVGGALQRRGPTATLTLPIAFTGRFQVASGVSLDVTVTGDVVATATLTTGREEDGTPEGFALSAAYPNPFNPRTAFALALAQPQRVRVAVYDLLGREVALLHDGLLPSGTHPFTFEAAGLPSGPYVVRAAGETRTAVQRLLLVK